MIRTKEEVWRAFEIQKQALQLSCAAYDLGYKGEAVRLANAIFILLGQKMKNHESIMEQLGILQNQLFPTTVPLNNTSGSPLYSLFIHTSRGNYVLELMPLGRTEMLNGRALLVQDWWNEIVMKDDQGIELSRGLIIRSMRDRDGGAHFDAKINDPIYLAAMRGKSPASTQHFQTVRRYQFHLD